MKITSTLRSMADRRLGQLRRGAVGMAAGTTLSRATGLVRTMALASALGVTVTGDAYNIANTAPNMIFTLVAGGALSAAVVPILIRAENRADTASVLLGATLVVGVVVSAVVAVASPLLIRALTAGAAGRADYASFVQLASTWLRMFAPQIALYALSVLAVGIMTARRHLALGAVAPVATNVITIVVALVYLRDAGGVLQSPSEVSSGGRAVLGWGTTIAVGAMVAIQILGAHRAEPGLRIRVAFGHPAIRELASVGKWVVVYVILNQIGLAVVTAVASVVPGGVTAYQWGFTVMQLPYAIVAVSLLSAATPTIAAATSRSERADSIEHPARMTLRWILPAAVGLFLLADPLATIVVGTSDSSLVRVAIMGFALSLVPFSMFQLLVRASYALSDSRRPAVVNVGVNVVNVAFALVAVSLATSPTQQVTGLAVSHAASYAFGAAALGWSFRRHGLLTLSAVAANGERVVLATLAMVVGLASVRGWAGSHESSRSWALMATTATSVGALAVYAAAASALGLGLDLVNVNVNVNVNDTVS
ncbi:MAG: hypothetical protein OSA99_16205 [Acidimicrobiales bacterium]|nr:hypothetical protein [Acidimicrobiales bacterium]